MENFEYKGYCFLPDSEIRIAGILTYNREDSIVLELIGDIDAHEDPLMAMLEGNSHPVIWGVNSEAKSITLLNCRLIGKHLNLNNDFPIMRYSVQYVLVGKYVRSLDEPTFNSCQVRIPALTTWCFPALIQQKIFFNNENRNSINGLSISTNTETLEDPIASVDIDDVSVELKRGLDCDLELVCPKIEQYTYLRIKRDLKDNLNAFLYYVHIYEQFLSFVTLSDVCATEIQLVDNDRCMRLDSGKTIYDNVQLYYVQKHHIQWNGKKTDFLFMYDDIKDKYVDIIKKWYLESEKIAPIRMHLIDSVKRKEIFSSVDFLIVFQAIEGFAIRFLYGDKGTKNNIKAILREFSDIEKLACDRIDLDAAIDSRHYYSHLMDKSKKPKALDGIELYQLTKQLRNLLVCCMLTFIGFSHDEINDLLSKHDFTA